MPIALEYDHFDHAYIVARSKLLLLCLSSDRRVGLSRTEYLRRQLHREARRSQSAVTVGDLSALSGLLPDLDDPQVMREAWS